MDKSNIPSKASRRGASHQAHSVINMADAWKLHRSSSPPPCVTEKDFIAEGNNSNNEIDVSMSSDAQYCYYLLEAMPLPGPTWSTTEPSILAEPPSAPVEAPVGLEWGENQASSFTWWLRFLEGLDGNMTKEKLDLPFVENIVMENSKGLSYEPTFVDAIDLSCCPDDWFTVPTMEKDLGDMVVP
ncbi:hypothetical protein VNO77_20686 [Canavalia gladiata]|uniref:Uncharacterized protein n=1 Tax=Canavalia gladiata TaxID=3824 RepID=A0AAN9QJK7_CANGL